MDDNPIIVALDVPGLDEAVGLARQLKGEVGAFKVGLELFGAHGPEAVRRIGEFGPLMLDLKLHDIPTTVERAARVLGRLGVWMLTVHASGGATMISAAVTGLTGGAEEVGARQPLVLGVTALTSLSDDDLSSVGMPPARETVPTLARLAATAGAPGLVCAPRDLRAVREAVGPDVTLVTPGVRPEGATTDDHARAATPAEALFDGADHLVIGRPITRAPDPVAAARAITESIGTLET